MRDAITVTTVLLTGTREAIIRILNRAFRMSSSCSPIADDDDLNAINSKIRAANEHKSGCLSGFTLMDYMDLQSKINSPFEDIILSYIDEEEPDGSENYDANPVGVTEKGDEYILKIVSRVRDGQITYEPEHWHYWCAMMSISDDVLIGYNMEQGPGCIGLGKI